VKDGVFAKAVIAGEAKDVSSEVNSVDEGPGGGGGGFRKASQRFKAQA
jgi:hypothetical protein